MKRFIGKAVAAVAIAWSSLLALPAHAAVPTNAEMAALMAGGHLYLKNAFVQDAQDATKGSWGNGLPDTAAAVAALLETGKYGDAAYAPLIDKGVNYIKTFVKANGGIYHGEQTYDTGLALVALALYGGQTSQDAAFKKIIDDAMAYFVAGQSVHGGWSYSPSANSEDLSNTQFGAMGMYYGSRYRGVPIDASVVGSWSYKLYNLLKPTGQTSATPPVSFTGYQVAASTPPKATDGRYQYGVGYDYSSSPVMTGAGLWSLAMVGKGNSAEATAALNWLIANKAATDLTTWKYGNTKDYYMVYALAKALTATVGTANPLGTLAWVDTLKTALMEQVTASGVAPNVENHWVDSNWLSSRPIIATSFVLMSLAFADTSTAVTERLLAPLAAAGGADPVDPQKNFDSVPVKGAVTLQTTGGATITSSNRRAIEVAARPDKVTLPIGVFDFTIKLPTTVPATTTTDLKVQMPIEACQAGGVGGFIKAGAAQVNANHLRWFKIKNGKWEGDRTIPVTVDPITCVATVTLTDNGAGDDDPAVGVIKDPGAPGLDEGTTVASALQSTSSFLGCSVGNGTPDPTLLLLVAGGAVFLIRRRRQQQG